MREVMPQSDVADAFVKQSQVRARSSGDRMRFIDQNMYSYRLDYQIAHYDPVADMFLVLDPNAAISLSTRQHVQKVERAIRNNGLEHKMVYTVGHMRYEDAIDHSKFMASEFEEKAARRRRAAYREYDLDYAELWRANAYRAHKALQKHKPSPDAA